MSLVLITIQGRLWTCWLLFLTLMCCISAYLTRCDFNNNSRPFCDWTQPCNVNQGVWIRTKHDTPTDGTGPDGDYPDGSKCLVVALFIFLFWRQLDHLYSSFFEREKRLMKPFEMYWVRFMLTPVFDFSPYQTGVNWTGLPIIDWISLSVHGSKRKLITSRLRPYREWSDMEQIIFQERASGQITVTPVYGNKCNDYCTGTK